MVAFSVIDIEQREKIFDPFARIDKSRHRQSGGFGLGLAIVAKIAGWHKGSATMTESDAGGARLEIRWPTNLQNERSLDA